MTKALAAQPTPSLSVLFQRDRSDVSKKNCFIRDVILEISVLVNVVTQWLLVVTASCCLLLQQTLFFCLTATAEANTTGVSVYNAAKQTHFVLIKKSIFCLSHHTMSNHHLNSDLYSEFNASYLKNAQN